jgi:hypothetical protein
MSYRDYPVAREFAVFAGVGARGFEVPGALDRP